MKICERCNRPVQRRHAYDCASGKLPAYVKVVHAYYGCDTGCDGYVAYVCDEDDNTIEYGEFEFAHPSYGETHEEFALRMAHPFMETYKVPLNEMECRICD